MRGLRRAFAFGLNCASFAIRRFGRRPAAAAAVLGVVSATAVSCGHGGAPATMTAVEAARKAAEGSRDGEAVGRWLLNELLAPGGDATRVRQARAKLDALPPPAAGQIVGMYAALARGLDDASHGHLDPAEREYLDAARAARISTDANAPLVGWFAAHQWLSLRTASSARDTEERPIVVDLVEHPGQLGWRARSELATGANQIARALGEAKILEKSVDLYGCARNVRLAGPFGHVAPTDRRRVFAAEAPGPWPVSFAADPGRHVVPHRIEVERHGCQVQSAGAAEAGIYYVETYVDLPAARDVIVSVQGAYRVLVDDVPVLDRDTRVFGIWTKFGSAVRLEAGRHRIVARIGGTETLIRLLGGDGSPLGVATSDDPRPPYGLHRVEVLADPNVLKTEMPGASVAGATSTASATGAAGATSAARSASTAGAFAADGDPVSRYLEASLAHIEDADDVAAVLIEPLVVDPAASTGLVLAEAAVFAEKDPIFPDADRLDLVRDLRTKAAKKDPRLFYPRYWLALDDGDKRGMVEAVGPLRALADEFRDVPDVLQGLATVYGKLGWGVEHDRAVRELAKRFPSDPSLLAQAVDVLDEVGDTAEADRLVARIKQLDPDNDVDVDRALLRRDYPAAVAALEQIGKRRPDRKDIVTRIAEVMQRAGKGGEPWKALEKALAKKPDDAAARLKLADARFAAGDQRALRKALADAILVGADTSDLMSALELVEGATELEPFRLDGRAIIRAYEASGVSMEGTAARVLDYSAIWVHPDGSSRMLEHELIRIQSQEAVTKLTEQKVPSGLMLRMRVIKKDGSILEPEFVGGKPTLTMPKLEVGDYVETETVISERGDGQLGRRYVGPHWFFREADIAYWRSEIVFVVPSDKKLQIETQGDVPAPVVEARGPVVSYRWRVDLSPAAPTEPGSPPIREFLPSVRLGWGISLRDQLDRMVDAASDELPRDPRVRRIAEGIVGQAASDEQRAKLLYRWVSSNVEDGRETDGRRIVTGKSGLRMNAFVYLCRTLGIPVEMAAVLDRLSPKPVGPIAEAESFNDFVLRLGLAKPSWLIVQDKHAPFGYLPAELRGQLAYRLVPGLPRETTPSTGSIDGIVYDGHGQLKADGSATLVVAAEFHGKAGLALRAKLEQVPEAQLHDAIEGGLVGRMLQGARLTKLDVENQNDYDKPLILQMGIEVSTFARRRAGDLILSPPFTLRLAQLTPIARRQTPLLIAEPTYSKIHLSIALPKGARVSTPLAPSTTRDKDRVVTVKDRAEGGALVLDRVIDVPAGRVAPEAYGDLQAFTRQADETTMRDVVIAVP